jgi:hypothetical protein
MKNWIWPLFFLSTFLQAQQLIRQVDSRGIASISVDRYGQFYVADSVGNIFCFDSLGQKIREYTPQRPASLSLLECWRGVKSFAFYRDLQRFTLFNRFLIPISEQIPLGNDIGFARLATLALDESLWVFDESDFSLKKYNPQLQQLVLTAPLSLVLEEGEYRIGFMREYQNQLFLLDSVNGILVFDNLGNYRKRLPYKGMNQLGFLEEEVYFIREEKAFFFHLYTLSERSLALPQPHVRMLLIHGHTWMLVTWAGLFFYRY